MPPLLYAVIRDATPFEDCNLVAGVFPDRAIAQSVARMLADHQGVSFAVRDILTGELEVFEPRNQP